MAAALPLCATGSTLAPAAKTTATDEKQDSRSRSFLSRSRVIPRASIWFPPPQETAATPSRSTLRVSAAHRCRVVSQLVSDTAEVTSHSCLLPDRKWLNKTKVHLRVADHNPRVGGSSPSSGTQKLLQIRGFPDQGDVRWRFQGLADRRGRGSRSAGPSATATKAGPR